MNESLPTRVTAVVLLRALLLFDQLVPGLARIVLVAPDLSLLGLFFLVVIVLVLAPSSFVVFIRPHLSELMRREEGLVVQHHFDVLVFHHRSIYPTRRHM